ncbi:complement factor H-related protein 1-like isoform X2 [Hyperolius riggenbachi]|uniref:complement factor H-related protein 1-like isoform X2 n=1 Tax=Hyperolius riggenbachi TaxID=752182 RepID=UPI0035A3CB69
MLFHRCFGMFINGFLAFLTISLISTAAPVTGTCNSPLHGELNAVIYHRDPVIMEGDKLIFKCYEGYETLDGERFGETECLPTGQLSGKGCLAVCKPPAEISNGNLREHKRTKYLTGDRVFYDCDPGYTTRPANVDYITCEHARWTDLACKKICVIPSRNEMNSYIWSTAREILVGHRLWFRCFKGYKMSDGSIHGNIKCLPNGKLSGKGCSKFCYRPNLANGTYKEHKNAYEVGEYLDYECNEGFLASTKNPEVRIQCTNSGWTSFPHCNESLCGKPEEIANGRVLEGKTEYKHNEKASYECSAEYRLSGDGNATCLLGRWQNVPKCIYTSCEPPANISHVEIIEQKKNKYSSGDRVFYDCDPGYTTGEANTDYITCEDARWTEPACTMNCDAPPAVTDAELTEILKKSYRSGSSVQYECVNFYKLEGRERITCINGVWDKTPVCRAPCTVKEVALLQNNIHQTSEENKYKKIYKVHAEYTTFQCAPEYEILDSKLLTVQCLDGVINLPTCLKKGEFSL